MHSTYIQQTIDHRAQMYEARKAMIAKNRAGLKDKSKVKEVAESLRQTAKVKAEKI